MLNKWKIRDALVKVLLLMPLTITNVISRDFVVKEGDPKELEPDPDPKP